MADANLVGLHWVLLLVLKWIAITSDRCWFRYAGLKLFPGLRTLSERGIALGLVLGLRPALVQALAAAAGAGLGGWVVRDPVPVSLKDLTTSARRSHSPASFCEAVLLS
jgi:hypothetical protein